MAYYSNGKRVLASAGTIDNAVIGGTTPAAADVTVLKVGDGSASAPSMSFTSDPDHGFYKNANESLGLALDGARKWLWTTGLFVSDNTIGAGLANESANATNPTILPSRNDGDTGVGWANQDIPCMIAGGVNAVTWTEAASQIIIDTSLHAGLTAGTTQTQAGGLELLSSNNEISIVANTNDTVVLPLAVEGRDVLIINNGANTLRIYPAVGDDLGAGVDTLTTLVAGSNVTFKARDATNWEII